jgi:hypothetical protein
LTRSAHRYSRWLAHIVGPQSSIRTVEVLPPSRSEEGSWVFLTAGFVCLCVIYTLAFQVYRPDGVTNRGASAGGLPFQVMFRDLPSSEQRMFRNMKEGFTEALRARTADGDWPPVETLAASGVPPFAPDPLDKSALRWSQRRAGLLTVYLGVPPAGSAQPAFMIQILEPDASGGEQPLPNVVDEEHELLADGRVLHVTYWKHPPGGIGPRLVSDPALDGWLQIRVTSPFAVVESQ